MEISDRMVIERLDLPYAVFLSQIRKQGKGNSKKEMKGGGGRKREVCDLRWIVIEREYLPYAASHGDAALAVSILPNRETREK